MAQRSHEAFQDFFSSSLVRNCHFERTSVYVYPESSLLRCPSRPCLYCLDGSICLVSSAARLWVYHTSLAESVDSQSSSVELVWLLHFAVHYFVFFSASSCRYDHSLIPSPDHDSWYCCVARFDVPLYGPGFRMMALALEPMDSAVPLVGHHHGWTGRRNYEPMRRTVSGEMKNHAPYSKQASRSWCHRKVGCHPIC